MVSYIIVTIATPEGSEALWSGQLDQDLHNGTLTDIRAVPRALGECAGYQPQQRAVELRGGRQTHPAVPAVQR